MRGLVFVSLVPSIAALMVSCNADVPIDAVGYRGGECVGEGCAQPDGGQQGERDAEGADAPPGEPDAPVVLQPCEITADCVDPGPCETLEGTVCATGQCLYGRVRCRDSGPPRCNEADDAFVTLSPTGQCADATGRCVYEVLEVLPCPSCAVRCAAQCEALICEDANGGCQRGRCVPGQPATCALDKVEDGEPCDGGVCLDLQCVRCATDANCEDGNPCTRDSCLEGACVNAITPGASCLMGSCNDEGLCVGCTRASDCFDNDPCTTDTCGTGRRCSFVPVVCDDGNPCTADACQSGACSFTPDDAGLCPDGNCIDGLCVQCALDSDCPTTSVCLEPVCDQGQCRTDHRIHEGQECTQRGGDPGRCFRGDCRECSDREHCGEGTPVCAQGYCRECGTNPVDCDDDNPCTQESCSNNTCFHFRLERVPCGEDGVCVNGECQD